MDHADATATPRPLTRRTIRPRVGVQPPSAGADRRSRARRTTRCECWLDRESSSLFSADANVGPQGLFFRTGIPMTTGERVRVTLDFADGEQTVLAEGIVTRIVESARGQRHAVGVALSEVLEGDGELQRHLSKR